MPGGRVIASPALAEFFREEVSAAREHLGTHLSEMSEFYLVNLLCDFGRPENDTQPGREALVLRLLRALESDPAQQAIELKQLGDVSLYVSGFFWESLDRSLVDIDYYISMGGEAYGRLSGMMEAHPHGQTFADLYDELAKQFAALVDLLNEVAEHVRPNQDDQELLRLYDRWIRTGSERIRKLLVERGLIPADGLPTGYVQ
jgi:hypothetical protein